MLTTFTITTKFWRKNIYSHTSLAWRNNANNLLWVSTFRLGHNLSIWYWSCCSDILPGLDYRGSINRAADGSLCLPWQMAYYNVHFEEQFHDDYWHRAPGLGHHNYCANYVGMRMSYPYCYSSKEFAVNKWHIKRSRCPIPYCHDCMYGIGDGNFPGIFS